MKASKQSKHLQFYQIPNTPTLLDLIAEHDLLLDTIDQLDSIWWSEKTTVETKYLYTSLIADMIERSYRACH